MLAFSSKKVDHMKIAKVINFLNISCLTTLRTMLGEYETII